MIAAGGPLTNTNSRTTMRTGKGALATMANGHAVMARVQSSDADEC